MATKAKHIFDGPTLNPALRDFWEAKANDKGEPVRVRVLYGGRASSKSWDAAGFVIFLAQAYKIKVLCARQFQNKIEESVYSLLVATIERFRLHDQFRILESKIIHKVTGSEFIFYGLWRHITEIKSLEGIDICWLEEAHALTKEQWEVLEPTVRKEGSQFWIIFNPIYSTDFAWRRFVVDPPRGALVRMINYTDNPFLSQTMLDVIDGAKVEDAEEFQHIYMGVPRDNDDRAIIKRAWVNASIGLHDRLGVDVVGGHRIGFDVGDGGDDNAIIHAHGSLIKWADAWRGQEHELVPVTVPRVHTACLERDAHLVYDSIGMGAFVGGAVNKLNTLQRSVTHSGFNAGGPVDKPNQPYGQGRPPKTNKDMFANIKAQKWWGLADRFRNSFIASELHAKGEWTPGRFTQDEMIFIDPDIDHLAKLVDELCATRKDYDNAMRLKAESKKDMAKANREGGAQASTNLADAAIMATMVQPAGLKRLSREAMMAI